MSKITLNVDVQFGCWCAKCCYCKAPCSGKQMTVEVKPTETVDAIWRECAKINPKITGGTLTFERQVLDRHRKILMYNLSNHANLVMQVNPSLMLDKDIMGKDKKNLVDDDSDDEELQAKIKEKKAELAAKKNEEGESAV
eukprot:Trichotokara_eunicae@DN5373_c0_g1_i2.p1